MLCETIERFYIKGKRESVLFIVLGGRNSMEEFTMSEYAKDRIQKEIEENPFIILSKVVCKQIYREIIEGNLLPQHRIIESKIAKELNVSRSPIKMALAEMADNGILERVKGKELRVKKITYEECLWIYEARIMLEPEAAYLAARRISDGELKILKALVEKFEEIDHSHDHVKYKNADKLFHETIVKASRNRYLMAMYESIECPLAMYRNQLNQLAYEECFQQYGMERGSGYHRAIYRMLEQHYPMMAKDEMKNDVQRMYGTMSRLRGCDIIV